MADASVAAWQPRCARPAVVAAVQGQRTVVMDRGIRHGTDLVKALSLGARAVQCGHASAEGLAAGEAGVARAPRY
jgi:isopentenyl diphosphate isomerase/L-lactate dehydrogenase-like FMN-dependent dehydrogenase